MRELGGGYPKTIEYETRILFFTPSKSWTGTRILEHHWVQGQKRRKVSLPYCHAY